MTEDDLLTAVTKLADGFFIRWLHIPDSRKLRGTPGVGYPDLTLCGSHDLCFAELKAEFGKESTEQVSWRYKLQGAGQRFYVWRPSDLIAGTIRAVLLALNAPRTY